MKRDCKYLDAYIDNLFQKKGYPGMAVSIRGPEGVLFEKGFGYRDLENRKPADQNTIFGIASMSKSMTALACCILQTEGRLSLSDPIAKYFPSLHLPGTPDECVTLRTIAMHQTGLPPLQPLEWSIAMNSIERDSEWYQHMLKTAPNKMDKIEQIVEYLAKGNYKMLGAPGEYMSYSNEGYALLSYVVDMAAGISLEAFLEERIFRPLGMSRSVLDEGGEKAKVMSGGNITSLFERDERGELIQDDNWSVLPPFRGCACVKSTAADMTRYYKMLSDRGLWEGGQIVPEEAVELLIGNSFPLRAQPYYCLGLTKSLLGGKTVCQHTGGLHGVSSIGGFLEGGYSVTVLCNEGEVDVEPFYWACCNFILGLPLNREHNWAVPNGRAFSMPEALCGDYLAEEGLPAHTIVKAEDGTLKADYNGTKTVLQYCGGTVFAAVSEADLQQRVSTFQFLIRDGKAWAVRCYNRIYQRVEEPF